MAEEAEQVLPGQPLRITVRPRSDDFARVSDIPTPPAMERAPWLGDEVGDDVLPPSAAPAQGNVAPWLVEGQRSPTGDAVAPWLATAFEKSVTVGRVAHVIHHQR